MTDSFLVWILVAANLLVLLFLLFWARMLLRSFWSPPWVRTSHATARAMLSLAGVKPGERVVDFGSGDGTLVLEAAKTFGASGTGLEHEWALVRVSRQRAKRASLAERAVFLQGNFFALDWPPADVVMTYLFDTTNARLEPRLKRAYPSGTRVVSRAFPFPTLPLVATQTVGKETLYLYRIP